MITAVPLGLDGLFEIIPARFADARGCFAQTWNNADFTAAGIASRFVQDNHVHNAARGTVRGLHYQVPPKAQDKLVRVVRGSIFDVAVDLRRSSPTFGKWAALIVSAEKWNQLFVPRGFAHGYLAREDDTDIVYKVSDAYSPAHERSIRFDDAALGIDWPIAAGEVRLSARDRDASDFLSAEVFD